jgi:hypothetical protein
VPLSHIDEHAETPRQPELKSDDADVLRLRALLALRDLELDPLVLLQRPETAGLNSGEVNEHVVTAPVLSDETETLVAVEPLDSTLNHYNSL